MDIRVHAQLMATHCVPRIADLVMRVPKEKPGDDRYHSALIRALVHGCSMARNCKFPEAVEAIYVVTERLFATATPANFDAHSEGHMSIVREVAHAAGMGVSSQEGFPEMLAAVQPMVEGPLPQTRQDMNNLRARLYASTHRIRDISYRVLAERYQEIFARAMGQRI